MTQNPTGVRCPSGVPWCVSTVHDRADSAHVADLDTLDLGPAAVGVILYRFVEEADPARAMVRVHYGPDDQERPNCLDLPPAVAAVLGEIIGSLTVQTVFDFGRALAKGAALLEREAGR